MVNRLFVYGTLGPGQSHEHLLKKISGHWQAATMHGRLHPNGLGPTFGYPTLDIRFGDELIYGHVYYSRQLPRLWKSLDDYEGRGYRRVVSRVHLPNGQTVMAWVYALDANAR